MTTLLAGWARGTKWCAVPITADDDSPLSGVTTARSSVSTGRGGVGLTAMAVLHCFHFDYLNFATGRLDPSYEGIARMTRLARSTVAQAIAKLRRLGIINWVRRCEQAYEDGVFSCACFCSPLSIF